MTLSERLRDFWRGYSDADVERVRAKMANPRIFPGGVIIVTKGELKALLDEPTPIEPKKPSVRRQIRKGE